MELELHRLKYIEILRFLWVSNFVHLGDVQETPIQNELAQTDDAKENLDDLVNKSDDIQRELERMKNVLIQRETLISKRLEFIQSSTNPELCGS